jgi:hypothetical protein
MFNWRDYLVPERALRSTAQIFAVVVIGVIALGMTVEFLAALRLSVLELVAFAFSWLVASLPAYVIRERRRPRRPERPARGVERIPLIPVVMEDEE